MTTTNKMHPDLKWLVRVQPEWQEEYTHAYVMLDEECVPQFVRFNDGQGYTKAQWQAARKELGLDDGGWSEWIEWGGGYNPMSPMDFVEAKPRGGPAETGPASAFYWHHDEEEYDIIAYRYKLPLGGWTKEAIKAAALTTPEEDEQWEAKERSLYGEIKEGLDDLVNHPPHYQSDNGIECIDAIRAALGLDGFVAHCRGTAIKYCWRSGKKEKHAEDLRKAAWYLNEAAEALEE